MHGMNTLEFLNIFTAII